ncbi:hypothetical protein MNBD_GAMMA11-1357 [hydrothermal vent metagenome]|uniref:Rhodanese domain-containing protein n=1 Tax=hydrothermal vent metagenome TaxID=652676 RepID=A0A3B0XFE4_9ZZZZ
MRLRTAPIIFYTLILIILPLTSAYALDVRISRNISHVNAAHAGKVVRIQRIQDQSNVLTGGYAKTSRKCPPFCIQPMQVAHGVTTVAELEVVDFIKNKLNKGTGILIDARTPGWYEKGTIPGSINIPFTTFARDSSELVKTAALSKLGVTTKSAASDQSFVEKMMSIVSGGNTRDISSKWDFSAAKSVLLWCNGIWCGQSPRAIKGMLALGYPAEKIYYYRGGMQAWKSLGLTVK